MKPLLLMGLLLPACATTSRLEALEARVGLLEEVTGLGPKYDNAKFSRAAPRAKTPPRHTKEATP